MRQNWGDSKHLLEQHEDSRGRNECIELQNEKKRQSFIYVWKIKGFPEEHMKRICMLYWIVSQNKYVMQVKKERANTSLVCVIKV